MPPRFFCARPSGPGRPPPAPLKIRTTDPPATRHQSWTASAGVQSAVHDRPAQREHAGCRCSTRHAGWAMPAHDRLQRLRTASLVLHHAVHDRQAYRGQAKGRWLIAVDRRAHSTAGLRPARRRRGEAGHRASPARRSSHTMPSAAGRAGFHSANAANGGREAHPPAGRPTNASP